MHCRKGEGRDGEDDMIAMMPSSHEDYEDNAGAGGGAVDIVRNDDVTKTTRNRTYRLLR